MVEAERVEDGRADRGRERRAERAMRDMARVGRRGEWDVVKHSIWSELSKDVDAGRRHVGEPPLPARIPLSPRLCQQRRSLKVNK